MQKWLIIGGRLEAVSFLLLLLVAMPLKYYAGAPWLVQLMGPVHGVLFLAYCGASTVCAFDEKWPIKQHILAYISAVIPCGTFWFENVYLSKKTFSAS
jgi:integral membrane protein